MATITPQMENLLLSDSVAPNGPQPRAPLEFSRLPVEIRLQIWRVAVPRGRVIFNLLPNMSRFKNPERHESNRISPVPTILHICHESRETGLQMFRLGFPVRIAEDFYWRPEADTIYFKTVDWLKKVLNPLLPIVAPQDPVKDIQHLAFTISREVFDGSFNTQILEQVMALQKLKTLTLLIEFERFYDKIQGSSTYVMYEPFDEPMDLWNRMIPSSVENQVAARLDKYIQDHLPHRKAPIVSVRVLGMKRFKPSGFCIPP